MTHDLVIAGAGCAGLALAARLVERAPGVRLAIVDGDWSEGASHKLWSWWCPADEVHSWFPEIPRRAWTKMRVATPGWSRSEELDGLAYVTVRSEAYRRALLERLDAAPGVERVTGRIDAIRDLPNGGAVDVAGRRLEAPWVFQSVEQGPWDRARRPARRLLQNFEGWVVETDRPTFDPEVATLMDFTVPQVPGALTFLYVLPYSETRALLEYTLFSPTVLPAAAYERALTHIADERIAGPWRRVRRERGVLPMEDRTLSARWGPHVLNLGAVSGMLKPSTGYAFSRIQAQAVQLADSWARTGTPTPMPRPPARFHLYDTMLLDLLLSEPRSGVPVFEALFQNTRFAQVLRFLDEGTSPVEDAAMFARLPWSPFLRAASRVAAGIPPEPRRMAEVA